MQGRLVAREIMTKIQSFPWKNWRKEIVIAKKNKIKFLEWTMDYKKFIKNPLIKKPNHVKEIIKKNNISINSVTADFFMQRPIFVKKKNNTEKYLKILFKKCNLLNIKYIIIPLVDNSQMKNINDEKKVYKFFKRIERYIKFYKVKILFELDLEPKKAKKFINLFGNSFGINYDTGNSAYYGHNFNEEKKYFKRVYNIHIKDRDKNGNSVLLGQGLVDFDKFFNYLYLMKYKKQLILQTFLPRNKKVVEKTTLRNLKFVMKNYANKKK